MVDQGRFDNHSPRKNANSPVGPVIFLSFFIIQKKVADSKNEKSRPTGAAFLLHKHEQNCNFITDENWALSE